MKFAGKLLQAKVNGAKHVPRSAERKRDGEDAFSPMGEGVWGRELPNEMFASNVSERCSVSHIETA